MGTEIPTRDEMLKRLDNYERVAIALKHLGAGELGDAERHVVAGLDALYAALASTEQDALRYRVLRPHLFIDGTVSLADRSPVEAWLALGHFALPLDVDEDVDAAIDKVGATLSERRANGEAPITDSLGSGE